MDVADADADLRSLTYVSSATALLTGGELLAMLEAVRPRNAELELSGMLLYSGGNIMQVIEGPAPAVERTFAQIARDGRHHDVTVLVDETVGERAFPEWSMGFRDLASREHRCADFGEERRTRHHAVRLLDLFRRTVR
ncbi:hypothetical protein GCM10023340_10730 [Nocardioides marinquilinus]|uniref:BLUF domain-containing protein n=1 Tax=Nocardioides marinquilinus TaxID=1210400 RepID=A0ABP9PBM7_9ACTN